MKYHWISVPNLSSLNFLRFIFSFSNFPALNLYLSFNFFDILRHFYFCCINSASCPFFIVSTYFSSMAIMPLSRKGLSYLSSELSISLDLGCLSFTLKVSNISCAFSNPYLKMILELSEYKLLFRIWLYLFLKKEV